MTTKLSLQGSRSLSKNWLKVTHIMRMGRVVKSDTSESVQQIHLQFEPEIAKNFAQNEEQLKNLAQVCTDGWPSCTMRHKTAYGREETRSGPLFQLQVVVQIPNKNPVQETRNCCFDVAQRVALLEKQLPRDGRVMANTRFVAVSRRHVKLRDMDALGDEPAAAPPGASQPVKASSFRWMGRGSAGACTFSDTEDMQSQAQTQPTADATLNKAISSDAAALQDVPASFQDVPASFKWRQRPIHTTTQTAAAGDTVGRKRGIEEEEQNTVQTSTHCTTKRIKIGAIRVQ